MPRTLFIPLLILALAAGGCTLAKPLAHHATSYNLTVESAQNRMLLLNVIRASQRMPMYFTDVTGIVTGVGYTVDSGSYSYEQAQSAGLALDTHALGVPKLTYQNKPTLTIAVRDDHEFTRGTLTPVSPSTLSHYLDQGWNLQVLLYLLVERVELAKAIPDWIPECGNQGVFRNDPGKKESLCCFSKLVETLRRKECRLRAMPVRARLLGSTTTESSLADLIKAQDARLILGEANLGAREKAGGVESARREVSAGVPVFSSEPIFTLACPDAGEKDMELEFVASDAHEEIERLRGESEGTEAGNGASPGGSEPGQANEKDESTKSTPSKKIDLGRLVLRSPQGVLYYLGEIARIAYRTPEKVTNGYLPLIRFDAKGDDDQGFDCPGGSKGLKCVPLFLVRTRPKDDAKKVHWASSCRDAAVAVEYGPEEFVIPRAPEKPMTSIEDNRCHPGRSMQSLTLVSQLISLQKKEQNLPGTALVRVVGSD